MALQTAFKKMILVKDSGTGKVNRVYADIFAMDPEDNRLNKNEEYHSYPPNYRAAKHDYNNDQWPRPQKGVSVNGRQ